MKLKPIYYVILLLLMPVIKKVTAQEQERYIVFFTDKNSTTFNPEQYFSPKAIERRIKSKLPLFDSTDYPVNTQYIQQLLPYTDSLTSVLRWFNAVGVLCNNRNIEKIQHLPFVKAVSKFQVSTYPADYPFNTKLKKRQKELLAKQIDEFDAHVFKADSIDGTGIRIAVFDTGFPSVDRNPVFRHIIKNKRVVATYDFARKREFVYGSMPHGTHVLSCIAGQINGMQTGLATGAEFLLARTEVRTEKFNEEENWLMAVEWADKHGADIINSSLGYTYHRYFTEQMDGRTSLVAQAATMAAKKGILVINAMGNDGKADWKILSTPADVDSVLSVGGINPFTGYHADYSSFGPAADMDTKPDVCAYSNVIVAGEYGFEEVNGTSFATPLVTGFAACLWQKYPNLNNMEIKDLIIKSGNLYPYFDYAHGYGIPSASKIPELKNRRQEKTFDIDLENNMLYVRIKPEILQPNKENVFDYLYYHIRNKNGHLDKYAVIEVNEQNVLTLDLMPYNGTQKLSVHYKGYTKTIILTNQQ